MIYPTSMSQALYQKLSERTPLEATAVDYNVIDEG